MTDTRHEPQRRAGCSWTGAFAAVVALWAVSAWAGPPFVTDDPEPVEHHHWELYAATHTTHDSDGTSGTVPHIEVNYGAIPGMQLHVILPLAYSRPRGGPFMYGPGDVELGVKVRFLDQSAHRPMVGTFPLLEVPSGSSDKGLGNGHVQAFLPIWLQKDLGPWETYGGGGYWLNPGAGDRDFWFLGWLVQRRLSKTTTVGGEVFRQTSDQVGGRGDTRFNLGLMLDLSEHRHVLLSAGRSLSGGTRLEVYAAYQITL